MKSKKLSRHDRQVKTALVYARQHTDFHIQEIKDACRIPKGRHEDSTATAIMRDVKDVAPFEVIPVWERSGWWTTSSTAEVRLVDAYRMAEIYATAMSRRWRLAQRHRRGHALTGVLRLAAKQAVGVKELFEDDLPDPERQQDPTLMRIDKLMS